MVRTDFQAAHAWVLNHDECKSFVVVYLLLAVVLSVLLSLFWLVVVVGIHLCFELVRQRSRSPSVRLTVTRALWELKLDFFFILFGFVVALYMDFALGLAGLGGVARLGRVGSTAGRVGRELPGFQRAVRGIALSADDIVQAARGAQKARQTSVTFRGAVPPVNVAKERLPDPGQAGPADNLDEIESSTIQKKGTGITRSDSLSLAFGLLCIALILVAPAVMQVGWNYVIQTVLYELQPFHP